MGHRCADLPSLVKAQDNRGLSLNQHCPVVWIVVDEELHFLLDGNGNIYIDLRGEAHKARELNIALRLVHKLDEHMMLVWECRTQV